MKYQKTCNILGVNIDVINMARALSFVKEHLQEMKGSYICVSNVHTTVISYENEKYRKVQNDACMVLPDGKPLSLVARHRGFKEADRVAGPDFMPEIFKMSKENGYRHFFYGSTQDTLDSLKERLLEQYSELQIAGMYSPPFRVMTKEEDAEVIKIINEAKPDFIWVGLGAPKQEYWMHAHAGKVNGLMIGVGAAFDFHSGKIKRAPHWVQETCMEWLFRIFQDPKRMIPRYLKTNFKFLWLVARGK